MISKQIRLFCEDYTKIENYEEAIHDIDETWICHHRLEIMPFSGKVCSVKKLKDLGMYLDVPPEALIFLRKSAHASLHNEARKANHLTRKKGTYHHSEEAKKKMSESHKGKEPWNKGKKDVQHHSEETKKKISEKMKGGNSTSWKKGQTAWNKGMPGHTKGKKRYTNGKVRIYAFECPEGFWGGWK